METKLLRKPWIAHALCSLLDRNRQPSVACAIVQLIQVEGAGAAIVSDRFHFIKVQFTAACIESFGRRRVRRRHCQPERRLAASAELGELRRAADAGDAEARRLLLRESRDEAEVVALL